MADSDRTASLMSPGKLAQMNPKEKVTPAAWLNQMAADAGHQHVQRIAEIGELLQEQATSPELAAVAARLQQIAAALPELDFSLLEPQGWWARTTGKSRSSGAEFGARFERIDEETRALPGLANALKLEQKADAALAERALVELDVECHALEKIIDQGTRWLQDMRNQLKLRQAAAATADLQAQQEILQDANRCDILVARLTLLRALCNEAAQVHQHARENAQRRIGLTQMLEQSLAADLKDWRGRISALAGAAGASKGPALGLEGPMGVHQELQSSVRKAVKACEQLHAQEQALALSLAALNRQHAPSR